MKTRKVLLSLLLALSLLLCLLPATALAAQTQPLDEASEEAAEEGSVGEDVLAEDLTPEEAEDETAAPAEAEDPAEETADGETPEEPVELIDDELPPDEFPEDQLIGESLDGGSPAEVVPADEPEEAPAGETLTVDADVSAFSAEGDTVYNNGGVIYNNGGVVYNNAGLVYANGGTVYNNGGTVYANGGTVYNNTGVVYNNGATVFNFGGSVEDSVIYGYFRVTVSGDGSGELAAIEGLDVNTDGALLIREDSVCTIAAQEGYSLADVTASAGTLTKNEDGSFTLSGADADLELVLTIRPDAPVLSPASGTCAGPQTVEITGPRGASIFYSLDGSDPGVENSIPYEGPFTLEESASVKAVAVAAGDLVSEPASVDLAIVTLTAPSFEEAEEGYARPDARSVSVENPGTIEAVIKSVALEGENAEAFTLNSTNGGRVAPGTENRAWAVRPAADLAKGSYSAVLVFTFDSGETAELPLSFEVR